ncbi:MAG TPA: NTP transferase domain-containing protein [Jiangellales bacterium]|nr:NTP transferase domain-containing protein [Jiangellales bacterium]
MRQVAGLVLAAGAGRRFGGPKALVEVAGERLVDRAVRVLREGGCAPVVVVSGAASLDVAGAEVVAHPGWEQGMGSSFRAGLAACPREAAAVVVVLVDTPWLSPEAVRRVVGVGATDGVLAVATYEGRRGHPVLLGLRHWAGAAAAASGDRGARDYLAARGAEVLEIACDGLGDPRDVDLPADLRPPGRR